MNVAECCCCCCEDDNDDDICRCCNSVWLIEIIFAGSRAERELDRQLVKSLNATATTAAASIADIATLYRSRAAVLVTAAAEDGTQ